ARRVDGGAVARAGPLEVLGMGADARDEAERLGRGRAHVEPGVTPVAGVDQLRGGGQVLPLEPALPEIRGLEGAPAGGEAGVRWAQLVRLAGSVPAREEPAWPESEPSIARAHRGDCE